MKRITQQEFYVLGAIQRLECIEDGDLWSRHKETFLLCKILLEQFVANPQHRISLPASIVKAGELLAFVRPMADYVGADFPIDLGLKNCIRTLVADVFSQCLSTELWQLPTFLVEKVGIFSSNDLIHDAVSHLGAAAIAAISDGATTDFNAAGACLAFHNFTACGFHVLRALESVVRQYVEELTGESVVLGNDSALGPLIDRLQRVLKKEENVQASSSPLGMNILELRRIKNVYRNPIMHPQMVLDEDSARTVFNRSASVISAIVDDLADRRNKVQQPQ